MRILYVATDYPERGMPTTGFPNYLYRASLALVQMGHEPVILSPGRRDGSRSEQGIRFWTVKIEYTDYRSQALCYTVNALRKSYILNRKVSEIIKKQPVDIIQFTSLEGSALFYRGSVPAVLRLSSYAKTYFSTFQTFSPAKVKAMSFIERWSARRCNVVFAPCRITAQAFGRDCRRKVHVIETPFVNDVQEYDNTYVEEYLKDKKYVLFFGSLYAEKGILIIADILEKFLRENEGYYFVFVGDVCDIDGDSSANILKRKAGNMAHRIIIWSALPHKQLYPIIRDADFVVLPSLMDNLPNACIEAMYFQKVVVGTEGASFEQLITHGKDGFLCEIGNSEDLYEKMKMAVSLTSENRVQMGIQAGKRIDKLKPEVAVKKLLRLYEYMVENSK